MLIALLIPLTLVAIICMTVLLRAAIRQRAVPKREAVALGKKKVKFEASGGVTLKNVRQIAATGVDYISVGALTHSAPAINMSLELTNVGT